MGSVLVVSNASFSVSLESAGADNACISTTLCCFVRKEHLPVDPPHQKCCLRALRKSVMWYAYKNGFRAELTCESTMKVSSNQMGTLHLLQNACTQLTVYSGIQHIMKKTTMMARFLAVRTSLLLVCCGRPPGVSSGDCNRLLNCRLLSELDVEPLVHLRFESRVNDSRAEPFRGSCCSRAVIWRS